MRSEEKRRDICSSDGSQIQLPGELLALIRVLQHGGEEQQKPLRERASECLWRARRKKSGVRSSASMTAGSHSPPTGRRPRGHADDPHLPPSWHNPWHRLQRLAACACAARGASPRTAPCGLWMWVHVVRATTSRRCGRGRGGEKVNKPIRVNWRLGAEVGERLVYWSKETTRVISFGLFTWPLKSLYFLKL